MRTLTEPVGAVKVLRHPSNEEGRVQVTGSEEVGDERSSSSLAVGSGYHHRALAADKEIAQHFRQGQVRDPAREYGLGLWIAARDCIANYDQIRRWY